MQVGKFRPGRIKILGETYSRDIIVDRGKVRKRRKKPSRQFRDQFGHTPLSLQEPIPWECKRLIVGTGAYGRLPIMEDVKEEATRRGVELVAVTTPEAVKLLKEDHAPETNAILHVSG